MENRGSGQKEKKRGKVENIFVCLARNVTKHFILLVRFALTSIRNSNIDSVQHTLFALSVSISVRMCMWVLVNMYTQKQYPHKNKVHI